MEHADVRRGTVPEHILACPACAADLVCDGKSLVCAGCREIYSRRGESQQWDVRLRSKKSFTIEYTPRLDTDFPSECFVNKIVANQTPEIAEWKDVHLDKDVLYGNRLTRELLSYFPKSDGPDQWMLDLGCGDRQFEQVCSSLTDFNYWGIDYGGSSPNMLADAHALPFKDSTFSFIISIAVLEHLSHPDVAMAEAFRVLKPGGTFIGTVAFLEPFHMDSHFHMTHLGTQRVLTNAGFEVVAIAPNEQWTGLRAQAEMSLFPGLRPGMQQAIMAPAVIATRTIAAAKRMLHHRGKQAENTRHFETTGGFRFVARRGEILIVWQ